ncbi:YceH family protein [Pseudoalteromonas tunicata]|jgi:uncharacterized protein YceH (UPF0502 family)|uniref:Uncharacterized protein n=1 Tax=Pseudoalteromonas tunicata D2 TaxID=87626 RepID=A4CF92_9GAMM|nr:DUF480 domain-containing protein [Pseudoalteromonas tunicata]ATC96202.1 hypothetical protein PTUN_a3952 [Pseudoalteromonas tunicata]AXT31720.1 DUF480 domain-containing protein [Pseudoalteromonas tunicata]EAR26640.1 hypothetical protein PTD2_00487 [Pseudoalteromonas tunicata D2]MDP4985591.1 YceH family protein [Pseudoalteromonas tunicata]
MELILTPLQARVIGCMLEKEVTTPEQYPMSVNSLANACNQKSNREPVLALTESEIQNTLDELAASRLVTKEEGFSGRVDKYTHRFCNTEFGSLKFTPQQKAIICVMLLRGPQTPGELRTRTNRLAEFSNVQEVEEALNALINQGYVAKHPREPGKRESRYSQLFSELAPATQSNMLQTAEQNDEVAALNLEIDELKQEIADLKHQVAEIKLSLGL